MHQNIQAAHQNSSASFAIPNNVLSTNEIQSHGDLSKIFMEILDKRNDENRMLKQRIANLTNAEIVRDNDTNSLPWTHAELCKAFSLQRLNIPLFNYLRDKFSIPLPSVEDVSEFVRKIQLIRGLQTPMLQMLEYDGHIYQDHEKVTILQISYVKTAEIYEYDETADLIWGPHKFLTLIIARGLYSDWSQMVYLNFDTRVTKSELNNVIEALHKINFSIAGITCNFEEGKSDVFTELSVCYGKGFFPHPITSEKIFCFYYLNDLLQATNSHFVTGHLSLDDGQQNTMRSKQPINKQV